MSALDTNGKRINNWDRITRNGLFVFVTVVYGFQFIAPYFLPKPSFEIEPSMLENLKAIVQGLFWFLIGRNTQPASEKGE